MTVRTGTTEPTWPEKKGAKLIEYSELDGTALASTPDDSPPPRLPREIEDRYNLKYDPDDFVGIG